MLMPAILVIPKDNTVAPTNKFFLFFKLFSLLDAYIFN
jgi:hypothetical protein